MFSFQFKPSTQKISVLPQTMRNNDLRWVYWKCVHRNKMLARFSSLSMHSGNFKEFLSHWAHSVTSGTVLSPSQLPELLVDSSAIPHYSPWWARVSLKKWQNNIWQTSMFLPNHWTIVSMRISRIPPRYCSNLKRCHFKTKDLKVFCFLFFTLPQIFCTHAKNLAPLQTSFSISILGIIGV